MSSITTSATSVGRIPVLEGVRAYLAWWVVGYHILSECGFEARFLPGVLRVIGSGGGAAVCVFIALSGFVITHLLVAKKESYRTFITRRFFRVYPAFIVAVALGAAFLPAITSVGLFVSRELQARDGLYEWWPDYEGHFGAYLATSATMLHGAVPNAWLPHAQAAFISPGWSISLEWQFYLVIPFILVGFFRFPLLVSSVIALVVACGSSWPIGEWGSFLPQRAEYFLLGCVSYFVFRLLPNRPLGGPLPLTVWTALFLWALFPDCRAMLTGSYDFEMGPWLQIGIWMMAMAVSLDDRASGSNRLSRWICFIFTNRLTQKLGAVSFSTYLYHYFAIYIGLAVFRALGIVPQKYHAIAVVLPITVVLTLVFSFVVYYFIERPGINLGQRITKRFAASLTN